MPNLVAYHQPTRAAMLKRLTGVQRMVRKLVDDVREGGELRNHERHGVYLRAEAIAKALDSLRTMLDFAKPQKPKRRKDAINKEAAPAGPVR